MDPSTEPQSAAAPAQGGAVASVAGPANAAGSMPFDPTRAPALAPDEVHRRRLAALAVAIATGMLLGLAWWLDPSPRGFGTHQALGLPPCTWPERFGLPCPSCGMTTAYAFAAKGRFVSSFLAQPMGFLLAFATAVAFVVSLWTLATGRTIMPVLERLWGARLAYAIGLVALLSWGYKTALMRGWIGE
jgi:hypothetical protein